MKRRLSVKPWLFPMPTPLVAAEFEGESGLLTVAWISMVSGTPPTIGMALRSTRRTLRLLEGSGEFTVNVPRVGMEAAVDFCGIVSGDTWDKWESSGLTRAPSHVVGAPIVAECPFNIECRVVGTHDLGDYRLVLGEIVETHADEEIVTTGGLVDMGLLNPLTYIPGMREYRGIGPKVADAYTVGLPLKVRP